MEGMSYFKKLILNEPVTSSKSHELVPWSASVGVYV